MTQAKLEKLVDLWTKRLRLRDWHIEVKLVSSVEGVPVENIGAVYGGTLCKPTFMEAKIQVRAGLDDEETELTVVHELIHVVFGGMIPPEGLYEHMFETGVEKVARTLLECKWQ